MNSFTIHLSSKNLNDGETENVDIRLGTISRPEGVFTFTENYSENAVIAPSPEGDWAADDYITFTFETPQAEQKDVTQANLPRAHVDCAAQKLHGGPIRLFELMFIQ